MIFVTVGHQMAFDRLVRLVDGWAGQNPGVDIFAQTANAEYIPQHFSSRDFLAPKEYEDYLNKATAIVAHAGTGTILQALYLGKPLLVLPRLAALGETRNDHQVGTARYFAERQQLLMAESGDEFSRLMDRLVSFTPVNLIGAAASPELIERIRTFLDAESPE
jgi:UDP-N-acetylglucosamine transferase subunit ALG13